MNRLSFLVPLVICAPAIVACSYEADIAKEPPSSPGTDSGTTGDAPPPDAGSSSKPDSGTSPDSGSGGKDSAATPEASATDTSTTPTALTGGFVALSVYDSSPDSPASAVAASFYSSALAYPPSCTERTDGSCTIETCPGGATLPTPTYVTAGTISVSGYPTPVTAGGDPFDPDGYESNEPGTLWTAGQVVSISTTGADVPAFDSSVAFPAEVEIQSPTSLTTVSISAGLSIAWDETTDSVGVYFSQGAGSSATVTITCKVAPPSSGFTLTPSMLADLATGSSTTNVNLLQVSSDNTTATTAGGYSITVEASTPASIVQYASFGITN
jgi:hypothetical protein